MIAGMECSVSSNVAGYNAAASQSQANQTEAERLLFQNRVLPGGEPAAPIVATSSTGTPAAASTTPSAPPPASAASLGPLPAGWGMFIHFFGSGLFFDVGIYIF